MSASLVACLTPPGQAALATLGLRGPAAWAAVRALFRLRSGREVPPVPEAGRFWLGRMGDEVVLAVKRAGPEPLLEAHCHGGRQAVAFLIELCREQGLTVCDWRQFLAAEEPDALRAEALAALAEAPTVRTAAILLDQVHGALGRALEAARAARERGDSGAAEAILKELAKWAALGRHLTRPWRVAVAGVPNVGKSSLVNALTGYSRSVVSPEPGTTRDVVTAAAAFDGWPVELIDTAGLRSGGSELEAAGVGLAREQLAAADLVLWVLDASTPPVWPEREAGKVRLVVNKIDLAAAWDLAMAAGAWRVSSRTGEGIAALGEAVGRWLVPEAPPAGAAVPFTDGLCEDVCRSAMGRVPL
jgi:tRNA modification GTPase